MPRLTKAASISRTKSEKGSEPPPYTSEDLVPSPQGNSSTDIAISAFLSRDDSTDEPAPSYISSNETATRPIAVPQLSPDPTAPLIQAYATSLLTYGITRESWLAFLTTLSDHLAAKGSDQAKNHAGDVAKQIGKLPLNYTKGVSDHAKSLGRGISASAKKGNVAGVVTGTIGGGIGLTCHTIFGAVGTVCSMPFVSMGIALQKPQTARQRAMAAIAAANKSIFTPRKLSAQLLSTPELAELVGVPVEQFLEASMTSKWNDAETQLRSLRPHIAELNIDEHAKLRLSEKAFWLVVIKQPDIPKGMEKEI